MDGSQTPPDKQHLGDNSDVGAEFLTFCLANETYGVDILRVQEIRGYDGVTRLPSAPEFIKGVINLRGTIVPVVDMRLKFKLGKADYNAFTVMIILNIARRVVGMVVDGVSDVQPLSAEQIRPATEFGGAVTPPLRRAPPHSFPTPPSSDREHKTSKGTKF